MMAVESCMWFRGDNARQPGWEQMRKRFSTGDSQQTTLLLFHESCESSIRTIPYLQHDDKNLEDIDTDGEDHAGDETRYACMSRPIMRSLPKPVPQGIFSNAQAYPTINQLIARQTAKRAALQNRY